MRCEHQQGCQKHEREGWIAKQKPFLQHFFSWRFFDKFPGGGHAKNHQNEERSDQNSGDRNHFNAISLREKADHQRLDRIQSGANPPGNAKVDEFTLLAVMVMCCVDEGHDGVPEQDQKTHKDRACPGSGYEWHDDANGQVRYGQHQDHVAPGKSVASIGDPTQDGLQQGCQNTENRGNSANPPVG